MGESRSSALWDPYVHVVFWAPSCASSEMTGLTKYVAKISQAHCCKVSWRLVQPPPGVQAQLVLPALGPISCPLVWSGILVQSP